MSENTTVTYNILVDEPHKDIIKSELSKAITVHGENTAKTENPTTSNIITNVCEITPIEAYMSTNLNSKLASYNDVATRILNMLGYPSVGVTELHRDQIYEAISIAVETYTKYCGQSEEVLVFDSRLYKENHGIRLDQLCTIASVEACHETDSIERAVNRGPDQMLVDNKDVYVTRVPIPAIDYYISEKEFELLPEVLFAIIINDFKKKIESINFIDETIVYIPSRDNVLSERMRISLKSILLGQKSF